MTSYYSDYVPQAEKKPTTKKKGILNAVVSNFQGVTIVNENHS